MSNKFINSIIAISRPANVLISMISIFVAAFITGTLHPAINVLLACISGGLIAAGANTINDYFDLEIDRINKPKRPLVAGKLSSSQAVIIALFEFAVGSLLALFIGFLAFIIAFSISLLLFLYSYRLKRLPLIGNLAVSFSTGMAFIYGGIAVHRVVETLIPAIFAFFYHFGREIIKDIQDREGDTSEKARTFPIIYGNRLSLILTTLNFALLTVLVFLPFLFGWYGIKYILVILFGVYPVIFFSVWSMWRNQTPGNLGFISNLLKADMLVGLLAIYLG
jgi:geranylgeranylglycerol-phosphate geranylgeranyltransferase